MTERKSLVWVVMMVSCVMLCAGCRSGASRRDGDIRAINRKLSEKVAHLNHENLKLRADNAELRLELGDLQQRYGVVSGLSEDLKRGLAGLIDRGDIEVLASGDLRIASKVLFKSGYFEITPEGKRVLAKVADVLGSGSEVLRIDGHTDTDPIVKARKRGITTNWHLSLMRGMKVLEELAANGISEKRMYIAGFGQEWPIADNNSAAGKKRNRRVEIVRLPARRIPVDAEAAPEVK